MSESLKATPAPRVTAMEGIRAAISDLIDGVQRPAEQVDTTDATIDVVSLSPEALGVPATGAKVTSARRELEMSRYRAAASGARAVGARISPRETPQGQPTKG